MALYASHALIPCGRRCPAECDQPWVTQCLSLGDLLDGNAILIFWHEPATQTQANQICVPVTRQQLVSAS